MLTYCDIKKNTEKLSKNILNVQKQKRKEDSFDFRKGIGGED